MLVASRGIAMDNIGRSSWDVTPFAMLVCVIASIGGSMFGYEIGMSSETAITCLTIIS